MGKNPATEREGDKFRRELELETIAQLLLSRATYREIAEKTGLSLGTVAARVKVLRKRWSERQARKVDEWKAEEIASLELLERAFYTRAIAGDPRGRELRARLNSILAGHEVQLPDSLKAQLDKFFSNAVGRDVKAANVILNIKRRKARILEIEAVHKRVTGKDGGPVEVRLAKMDDRQLIEEMRRTGAWDELTPEAQARYLANAGLSE